MVLGRSSGFDAQIDLSSLNGHNGFRLDGGGSLFSSIQALSSTADVNGDGFDDVIVDALSSSYVVFGHATG